MVYESGLGELKQAWQGQVGLIRAWNRGMKHWNTEMFILLNIEILKKVIKTDISKIKFAWIFKNDFNDVPQIYCMKIAEIVEIATDKA